MPFQQRVSKPSAIIQELTKLDLVQQAGKWTQQSSVEARLEHKDTCRTLLPTYCIIVYPARK